MNNVINKLKQYIPDSSFGFVTGFVVLFYLAIALLYYCGEDAALSVFWVPIVIHVIHLFWVNLALSVAVRDGNQKDIHLLNNIGAANAVFLTLFASWLTMVKFENSVVAITILVAGLAALTIIRTVVCLNNDTRGKYND